MLSWDYDGTLRLEFEDLKADVNCDVNNDEVVNFDDINVFVNLLVIGDDSATRSYVWDAENRLIQFGMGPENDLDYIGNYAYDYLGRRVWKEVKVYDADLEDWVLIEQRRYVWDGWKLLEELDAMNSNAVARQYTWGLDLAGQSGAVNSLEGAGTIGGLLAVHQEPEDHVPANPEPDITAAADYLFFCDGNGNVGQLVAWKNLGSEQQPDYTWAGARLAAAYQYTPYGAALASSSGPYVAANRFRFSTKPWDPESGLGYWGYRYYDPRLGRWISRDPMGEGGGIHLYRYAANAPAHNADALGEYSIVVYYEETQPGIIKRCFNVANVEALLQQIVDACCAMTPPCKNKVYVSLQPFTRTSPPSREIPPELEPRLGKLYGDVYDPAKNDFVKKPVGWGHFVRFSDKGPPGQNTQGAPMGALNIVAARTAWNPTSCDILTANMLAHEIGWHGMGKKSDQTEAPLGDARQSNSPSGSKLMDSTYSGFPELCRRVKKRMH